MASEDPQSEAASRDDHTAGDSDISDFTVSDHEIVDIFQGYRIEEEPEPLFQVPLSEYNINKDADIRGTANPSLMDKPFWKYMVRHGGDAYSARMSFVQGGDPYVDDEPVWSFQHFGATRTKLPDGRIVCIAGEHEDFYDPDFYIYNGTASKSH